MATFTWPPISVSTSAPVGGATSANQLTEIAELQALSATDFATEAKQDLANTKLDSLIAKDFATTAKQDLQITQATNSNTKLDTLIAKDFSTAANQVTQTTALNTIVTNTDKALMVNVDGVKTVVNFDSTTPANSTAVPVYMINAGGGGGGDASAANQVTANNLLTDLKTELLLKAKLTDTQPVSIAGIVATSQGSITGTIATAQKSVGLTAVRATVSGTALTSVKRRRMKPAGLNGGKIYYGGSDVTTANGIEVVGPDTINFDGDFSDYYLISDTAGQSVELIEVV